MNRLSKWRVVLYLAAIFLAGAVTGAVLTGTVGWRLMMGAFNQKKMAERWRAELQSRLKLTPEQMQRIAPIVDDTVREVRTVLTEQLSATISNSNARIERELTPQQKVVFQQMTREYEARMRQHWEEHTNAAPSAPGRLP